MPLRGTVIIPLQVTIVLELKLELSAAFDETALLGTACAVTTNASTRAIYA